ncbi:MAG: NAD-dependent epimerase/dehydratase family protein [Candidatus Aenigmatarchaeota archaeon]
MSKKFLVTGASGFLGINLCKYLVSKGHEVKGIDIEDFNYPYFADKIDFYKGDIRDKKLVEKITEDVDVIVHGAAALPLWSIEEIFSTNINGTRNILEQAKKNNVERVVYISSTSVYGIPEKHPVDENYPGRGVGPYGKSKVLAEKVCREFRKEGICVPILRPKSFAGPYRLGVFYILNEWVKDGKNIPIVGSGDNKYQLLHVDDLNDAIHMVSTKSKEKSNDTFNIGATEFGTLKGDLQKLLDYADKGKSVIPTPTYLVIPALKIIQKLGVSPLYEWIYETADKDHYVSVEKFMQTFGWKPEKSTAEVWVDTYKWYVNNFNDYEGKSGITHRVPWKQGILKLFKILF